MFSNSHPDYTPEKNLARRVATRNAVNTMANELRIHFQEVLTPYINKKVIKFSPCKTWTVKVENDLQQIEQWMWDQKFRICYDFSLTRVWVNLDKTFQVAECGCEYVKQQFTICEVDSDILTMCEIKHNKFRTDYTVEELIETRNKIRELESQVSQLKSTIYEFR
jgi:hypothetical protein